MKGIEMNKNALGFTMAEVLITLGVIGVIAAMTLPSIIQKQQKITTINLLKKSYNNLNNVFQMAVNDNGDMRTWDFSEQGLLNADSNFYKKYINPYLKTIKKNYKYINTSYYTTNIYNINGEVSLQSASWEILPDGTAIALFNIHDQKYFWIFIDINGPKKPNRLGKDIFMTNLNLNKNSLEFWSYYGCTKNSTDKYAGGSCGKTIISNGWEIPDTYPW